MKPARRGVLPASVVCRRARPRRGVPHAGQFLGGGGRVYPGSRQRAELLAVGFAAFDAGGDFGVVAVGESGAETVEFVFETGEGTEDFVAVLLEDGAPDLRVAAGDAGGIAEAAAGEVAPRVIFLREETAETGGDHLREMADVGDDLVVAIRGDGGDFGAEVVPEFYDGGGGVGGSIGERSDEAGAAFEKGGGAVLPAGFFGAGHGVGADEVRVRGEGGVSEAGDFGFYAADIGDERAGGEVGCDLAGERDDLIDGGGEDNERGAADGFVGGVGDGVAPRLLAEFQASFGTAGPEDDAGGHAAGAGGAGDGTAEEAGGENRELGEGGHRAERRKKVRRCRALRRNGTAVRMRRKRAGWEVENALRFGAADVWWARHGLHSQLERTS